MAEHDWVRVDGVASDRPIPRVQQFVMMDRIKRHAYAVIAECCLDPEEAAPLHVRFSSLDTDNNGVLTLEELRPDLSEEAARVFSAADVDESGTLELHEDASAVMVKRMDYKRVKKAFDYFDTEGRGFITAHDLRQVLQAEKQPGAVEGVMSEVDRNKVREGQQILGDGV